jgi:hypothetical protein
MLPAVRKAELMREEQGGWSSQAGRANSSRRADFGHRWITVNNLARVRNRQIVGQSNAETSRYEDILSRFRLLPDVHPVLAVQPSSLLKKGTGTSLGTVFLEGASRHRASPLFHQALAQSISDLRTNFGHRRIAVNNLARVRDRQIVGQPNAETSHYGNVLIRFGLLPDVDPVLAVVEWGYRHMVESRQLTDCRQDLGLDSIRAAPLFGLFRRRFVFIRGGIFGFCHYFFHLCSR